MKIVPTLVAAATSAALALGLAPSANAAEQRRGDRSLVTVLSADGAEFDHNWRDFDIVEAAVVAVLTEKPESPVGVLADGDVRLTAFIPTDRAFRKLVRDLTGDTKHREKAVFKTVASLGIDTVEAVLLYHVVPGATITARQALQADGAKLETALGPKIKVKVEHSRIILRDKDRNDKNPSVVKADVNKGNKQIAHGIGRVLRPADL
jgi:hypothetical protein